MSGSDTKLMKGFYILQLLDHTNKYHELASLMFIKKNPGLFVSSFSTKRTWGVKDCEDYKVYIKIDLL